MAGRFEEAEAAFQRALEISPKFSLAWEGVALSRFYRGNWAAGYEALAKGKEASTLPQDRVTFDFDLAWAKFGEGKPAEAMKALDALDQSPDVKALPGAWVGVSEARALMSYLGGKYAEAARFTAQASDRAAKSKLPGGEAKNRKRNSLIATIAVQAKQGKGADAEKSLAALEEAGKDGPPELASPMTMARGLTKWAKGDLPGAAAELAGCWEDDYVCHWELAMAQEKAGDKAAADATWKQISSKHYRDAAFLWFVRPKS
jgi:tetratricopeptide (TPR) repeat protein